jgi:hypothetical protein
VAETVVAGAARGAGSVVVSWWRVTVVDTSTVSRRGPPGTVIGRRDRSQIAARENFTSSIEPVNVVTACWVQAGNESDLEVFREKAVPYPALDASGALVDLAPSRIDLQMARERASKLRFTAAREHAQPIDHAD